MSAKGTTRRAQAQEQALEQAQDITVCKQEVLAWFVCQRYNRLKVLKAPAKLLPSPARLQVQVAMRWLAE